MKKRILYILLGVMLLSVEGMGQGFISFNGIQDYIYNGNPQFTRTALIIDYGSSDDESPITVYSYSGNSFLGIPYGPSSNKPFNAGNYTVTATVTFNDISGSFNSLPVSFTIAKATPTLSLTNSPLTYTASAQSATVSSSVLGTPSNIQYNGLTIAPTNAGTYTITADFVPADVANFNSLTNESAGSFIINRAPITISNIVLTKVYDGTPTVNVISNKSIGSLSEDNILAVAPPPTFSNKIVANNYTSTVTYSLTTNPSTGKENNYYISGSNPILITNGSITKLPITLTASANTKVYDGTLSATATPTITTGALVSGDVGTYSETYDTKIQGTNKVLTPTVISILDASNASMIGNYSITYTSVNTGVINAKQLTIADPTITKSKEYDKILTANVTAGTLSNVVKVGSASDAVTASAVGTYSTSTVGTSKTITVVYTLAGADKDNYIKPVDKVYTDGVITAKQLTIADPEITKSKEYDKTLTANVTAGTLSNVVKVGSASDAVTASAVGTYSTSTVGTSKTITVIYTLAGADKDNYIKPVDKVYTDGVITAKQLTITAKPHTILYNGTNYSGGNGVNLTEMASGESISNLTGTLNYTGTSQGAKNVDIYTIIPNGLSSTNYNIVYVGDNLEIKKATLKVIAGNQSLNFGTPAAKILTDATFTYASLLGGDNASAITGSLSYSTNYTPLTSTGSAGIYIEPIISGLSAANYNLIAEKGNITITASPSSPVFQIPNAFTPNSDGHNDVFRIVENGYVKTLTSFRVYTKSGKMIFNRIDEPWDGRYDRVMQDADVYIWIADFINKNNVTEHLSGTVLLLK